MTTKLPCGTFNRAQTGAGAENQTCPCGDFVVILTSHAARRPPTWQARNDKIRLFHPSPFSDELVCHWLRLTTSSAKTRSFERQRIISFYLFGEVDK